MDYMREYEKWLVSPALTPEEHAELESIRGDEKEIREPVLRASGVRHRRSAGHHEGGPAPDERPCHPLGHPGLCQRHLRRRVRRPSAGAWPCAWTAATTPWSLPGPPPRSAPPTASMSRIFESLRPTPELSFAVREYGCQAGINVTASHNPKEYNGYKVYWSDGAQLPPQHAAAIARRAGADRHFHRRAAGWPMTTRWPRA